MTIRHCVAVILVSVHTVEKILYTFCSILFFDWGHAAVVDAFRGSGVLTVLPRGFLVLVSDDRLCVLYL